MLKCALGKADLFPSYSLKVSLFSARVPYCIHLTLCLCTPTLREGALLHQKNEQKHCHEIVIFA